MERIKIFHGSTIYLDEGFGSFHLRSTVMGGSAIIAAAEKLKEAIRAAAALRLNCAAENIVLDAGLARPMATQLNRARTAESAI